MRVSDPSMKNFNLTVHLNPPSQSITSHTCKERYIIITIPIIKDTN